MSEEKKEPWLNYLAMTTIIFAICATLSTFKGGAYSTKSVISQAQASDQWAYFQAKSIRESMYRIQKDNLELQLKMIKADAADTYQRYEEALKKTDENITRYGKEKEEIQKEAKSLETKRDDAQGHGRPFGIAVIFLQVAILLSSVSALFKRRPIWYLAIPVGSIGIIYFINGFFMFF